MKTVKEVSTLSGVSVRTLHYYDEIGLLVPSDHSDKGYRLYADESIVLLKQILLFKELGMSLKAISEIIQSDDYDQDKVLESQKKMLTIKKNRLIHLIEQIDALKEGRVEFGDEVTNFSETEWELMWQDIYKKQGEVQSLVLPPIKDFTELLKENELSKVLDLGCGTGRNTIHLLKNGFEVTATDISVKGIEMTKSKASKLGYTLKTACHDMRNIPFKDNLFDAVLCSWVSGHGNHRDMINHAKEMLRVVKVGGKIFVDYPSIEDERFGVGLEIEDNTFIDNMEGEEKIPHHYSDIEEIEKIYLSHNLDIKPYTYEFEDKIGNKHCIKAFIALVTKK